MDLKRKGLAQKPSKNEKRVTQKPKNSRVDKNTIY